jgi:hypothetical protein
MPVRRKKGSRIATTNEEAREFPSFLDDYYSE